MFFDQEARKAFDHMVADRQWQRANPENPICPGCKRREEAAKINYPRILDGTLVCAECADDEVWRATGCRFGQFDCDHDDCTSLD